MNRLKDAIGILSQAIGASLIWSSSRLTLKGAQHTVYLYIGLHYMLYLDKVITCSYSHFVYRRYRHRASYAMVVGRLAQPGFTISAHIDLLSLAAHQGAA